MSPILEICVDSLASARSAIRGGADRLELCSALAVGGLTPYAGLLAQIRRESDIPIRCLMRPRAGDFLYTPEEIELMAQQIAALKKAGADGFVIGCLTPEGYLDEAAMAPLIAAAGGSGLTLHRCIDVCADPVAVYRQAKALGMDTVLTSGGESSCTKGMDTIGTLLAIRDAEKGPQVLIGAGVKASVIRSFREKFPQACAFHASCKMEIESSMAYRKIGVPMGLPGLDEWHIPQTSEEAVREAKEALRR